VGKIHKPVLSEANGLVEVHCFKGREWNWCISIQRSEMQ
jgi:hypothetical protein